MKICVPIKKKRQSEAVKALKLIKGKADLAEIWLDQIGDLDLKSLISKSPVPLVCVYKRKADKGSFKGSYGAMSEALIIACNAGANYIDIPFSMPEKLNKKVVKKADKTKIIISHHNYQKTPSSEGLLKKARAMKRRGADIVKIATRARSLSDTLTIILLAQQLQAEKIPHILIAMGQKGALSRVLTPPLGGTIMFAPLTSSKASALGQLTVKELKEAWSLIKK